MEQKAVQKSKGISIRDTDTTSLMNPEVYVQMKILANDFISSKAIPQCWETASQVLVGLQTGLEMGMKPMEAMNSLYVVRGAVNVWGKATVRRLREHGFTLEYADETEDEVTAVVKRDDEEYRATFRLEDAEKSGHTKDSRGQYKIGWKAGQNRKLKLRYGAISEILKTQLPEVMGSAVGIAELENDLREPIEVKAVVDEDIDEIAEAYKKSQIDAGIKELTSDSQS